ARATSGRATRRRTSSSRRPSSGSGGSWTATGPALAEARGIEPQTGAASPGPAPAMAPGSVPSGTAVRSAASGTPSTFLVTDIERSTPLLEEQPVAMASALGLHDALLRAVVEGRGGTVFKTTGDGLLAVFDDHRGALEANASGT